MARDDEGESQNNTFSIGVKGGGAGWTEIRGRKIDIDVTVMGADAEMGASGINVGVGVSVAVGNVIVTVLVGYNVKVGEMVSVIVDVASGVGVLEGAIWVVAIVVARAVSSVGN